MNILSFDIEEWYFEKAFHDGRLERYATFDYYLDEILDLLDQQEVHATFFVVGKMAENFPQVVKKIFDHGHEIGCHSYRHTWLNKMSYDEILEDTQISISAIEQCVGERVISYRAPAFTVCNNNQWVFEILSQCGIENDSSVFPASRDFGGFPNFGTQEPTVIRTKSGIVKEYPIVMTNIMGKALAFSGGGYFRFFPLWFVKQQMRRHDYNICYFHIFDLIPSSSKVMSRIEYETYFKEPGTLFNRYLRHLKSNLGKKNAFVKMNSLINSCQFMSISKASNQIDWTKRPTIEFE